MPRDGRDGLEALEVRPGQHPGVEVRQQPGLLQDADGHGADVGEGVVVAVRLQPFAGLGPAVLRLVAQGEEGFLAAHFGAAPRDVEDLVGREEHAVSVAAQLAGDGDEGAVVALVAAEAGEGDEDPPGVGDDAGAARGLQAGVPHPGGGGAQVREVVAAGLEQHRGLADVQRHAVAGALERTAHRVRRRRHGTVGGRGSAGRCLGRIPGQVPARWKSSSEHTSARRQRRRRKSERRGVPLVTSDGGSLRARHRGGHFPAGRRGGRHATPYKPASSSSE